MGQIQDLLEAVAADLETNGNLPDHVSTFVGRRPRDIQPEDCPALVVWFVGKDAVPMTTVRYHSVLTVGVSWHEAAVEEAESMVEDPEITWAILDALELCETRAFTWSRTGIPDFPAGEVFGFRVSEDFARQGLTEGYALAVQVRVQEP